jgi:hypothetical protein
MEAVNESTRFCPAVTSCEILAASASRGTSLLVSRCERLRNEVSCPGVSMGGGSTALPAELRHEKLRESNKKRWVRSQIAHGGLRSFVDVPRSAMWEYGYRGPKQRLCADIRRHHEAVQLRTYSATLCTDLRRRRPPLETVQAAGDPNTATAPCAPRLAAAKSRLDGVDRGNADSVYDSAGRTAGREYSNTVGARWLRPPSCPAAGAEWVPGAGWLRTTAGTFTVQQLARSVQAAPRVSCSLVGEPCSPPTMHVSDVSGARPSAGAGPPPWHRSSTTNRPQMPRHWHLGPSWTKRPTRNPVAGLRRYEEMLVYPVHHECGDCASFYLSLCLSSSSSSFTLPTIDCRRHTCASRPRRRVSFISRPAPRVQSSQLPSTLPSPFLIVHFTFSFSLLSPFYPFSYSYLLRFHD